MTGYLERGDGRSLADGPILRADASPGTAQPGGVRPDHAVASPGPRFRGFGGPIATRRATETNSGVPNKPAERPGPAPDPILDAARVVLHKALNP